MLTAPVASAGSRIEWVWLHWSEYLLARDEFYRWFQKMTVALAPPVELQSSLKEKQWQLSHAQVLLHTADHQAVLLDRLLEEAASLFNRIGDPSVDEDAQQQMKAEYDAVKAKAQVGEGDAPRSKGKARAELRPARRQACLPHSRSLLLPGRER